MKKRVTKAVIPAAGMGTRFLPATKAMPKEMLPILDKPTIQFIVEEAVASGIEDILIIVSQYKNSIMDHFDYFFELEERLKQKNKVEDYKLVRNISDMAHIHYIRQKEPMGLGHAINMAKRFIGNEPFAILLGDDVIVQNNQSDKPALKQCIELFEEKNVSIVGVQEVEHKEVSKYGIIDPLEQVDLKTQSMRVKNMIEKPDPSISPSNYAILGRYVLTPSIFKELEETQVSPRGEIEITGSLLNLAQKEGVYAKVFTGKRYDIGSKIGYLKATLDISLSKPDVRDELLEYMKLLVETNK
ncbi:UTP-glucose-1-phosphate uridylyltransferase [Malacoplasma penetrans HF-2]|uniref:UTP--glucose-1-phosphate uridylyltransferase n=1 Tax=Malacoplasma penetrans (strain HF-2) TaxID=272633 RepID=Q8EX34_MALP2|nr:UTP--glucose-1-phosphate uridylyltransferase GalU [Malacoplasma penetrans]BAC43806.1 UTP-glucose-1-phosphate uridylyltransferase [Malacoplasma penetrans HF-2]